MGRKLAVASVGALLCILYRIHKKRQEQLDFANFLLNSRENDGKLINDLPAIMFDKVALKESNSLARETVYVSDSNEKRKVQRLLRLQMDLWHSSQSTPFWATVDWKKSDRAGLPSVSSCFKLIDSSNSRFEITLWDKCRLIFVLGYEGYARWCVMENFLHQVHTGENIHCLHLFDFLAPKETDQAVISGQRLVQCLEEIQKPCFFATTNPDHVSLFNNLGFKQHSKFRFNDVTGLDDENIHINMWLLKWDPQSV